MTKIEVKTRQQELIEEEKILSQERQQIREIRKQEDENWERVKNSIELMDEGMSTIMKQKFNGKRKEKLKQRKKKIKCGKRNVMI